MMRKAMVIVCGILLSSIPAFSQSMDNEMLFLDNSQLAIRAAAGYNFWVSEAIMDSPSEASAGGFTASVGVYYSIYPGIALGVEAAYLPLYFGNYPTSGATYDLDLSFLPIAAGLNFSSGALSCSLEIGYAPFIGSLDRISGTASLSADGFFFFKSETSIVVISFGNVLLHVSADVYLPLTFMLSSLEDEYGMAVMEFQLSLKAGVTVILL